jgi:hypothetical protein
VKVDPLIEVAFIARLKDAVRVVLTGTPVAPPRGITAATDGTAGGFEFPELALDPPHAEKARAADRVRNASPRRKGRIRV